MLGDAISLNGRTVFISSLTAMPPRTRRFKRAEHNLATMLTTTSGPGGIVRLPGGLRWRKSGGADDFLLQQSLNDLLALARPVVQAAAKVPVQDGGALQAGWEADFITKKTGNLNRCWKIFSWSFARIPGMAGRLRLQQLYGADRCPTVPSLCSPNRDPVDGSPVTDTDDGLTTAWMQRHHNLLASTGLVARCYSDYCGAAPIQPAPRLPSRAYMG